VNKEAKALLGAIAQREEKKVIKRVKRTNYETPHYLTFDIPLYFIYS
jgi:hypothetical protein